MDGCTFKAWGDYVCDNSIASRAQKKVKMNEEPECFSCKITDIPLTDSYQATFDIKSDAI